MTDLPTSRFQSSQQIGTLDTLNQYWRTKCGDHALPSRSDLDPAEFRYALGNVSLIDVVGDPPRFRIRVAASNVEARFDRALTGIYLEDLPEPESARLWDKVYRTVLATGQPQSFVGEVVEDEVARLYRATIWPLASNHRDVDMLLCCREPLDEATRLAPDTPETWTGAGAASGH
jgi:hypothetical protein